MTDTLSPERVGALVTLRRDLHAHPELAFDEQRTADVIAAHLAMLGIEVHRGIGGTGVVGVLHGDGDRTIGLRADMDALPVTETNDFAHASKNAGRMHACGHDGHVAILLAAAEALVAQGEWSGSIVFIFQPGEESGRGARAMIADGLFDRFPVDAVFAAHNWPGLAVGSFAIAPGPMMAACNTFAVTVTGKGGHAALPALTVNPVVAAGEVVQALQGLGGDDAVVAVTMIEAGTSPHIVPDVATLRGTVRTYASSRTDAIEAMMRDITEGVVQRFGCVGDLDFERNCAATINSSAEAELVRDALLARFGSSAVQTAQPAMTAEDFAFMLEARPGAYFWIGNGEGDGRDPGHGLGPCTLHNPSYDFDDRLIAIGAAGWLAIVERFFER